MERAAMLEVIDLGALRLKFLQSNDTTSGSLDLFEMMLQPDTRMPADRLRDGLHGGLALPRNGCQCAVWVQHI
jgi:hypothetical protein